jgi:hypothetical protein
VSGSITLTAPANTTPCSAAHAAALVSNSYSGVQVSQPEAGSFSIAGSYARTFLTVPSEVFPVITSASITSTTLVLGGAAVNYSATIDNAGVPRSPVLVQMWITQGANFKAAGGTIIQCGGADGDLPTGACAIEGSTNASNSATGSGTLVPGAAVLEITLRDSPSVRVLAGWRFNITLQ